MTRSLHFKYILISFFCFACLSWIPYLCAQSNIVLKYNFDQCILAEANGQTSNLNVTPAATCSCGPIGESLDFDGTMTQAIFPNTFDSLFNQDFTLSFYIRIDNPLGKIDILSKMRSCNQDTSLSLVYDAQSNVLSFQMQENFRDQVRLEAALEKNRCWHHIAIVRSGVLHRFFVNGVLKSEDISSRLVRLNNGAPFKINTSPCLGFIAFDGRIDEFTIHSRALNATEIKANVLNINIIVNKDTSLFRGESVQLFVNGPCVSNVQWSPNLFLTSANIKNPISSPTSDISYTVRLQEDGCVALDSIRIQVLDSANINCANIALPTAFSPNQDGLNETWGISNTFLVSDLKYLDIFDRNGTLIKHIEDPAEQWDGSFNNNTLLPGNYFWRIAYTCQSKEFKNKGEVVILR